MPSRFLLRSSGYGGQVAIHLSFLLREGVLLLLILELIFCFDCNLMYQ